MTRKKYKKDNKPWVDSDCSGKRKQYFKCKNNYRRGTTNENKDIMSSAGRLYKKSINKAFKKYQNDLIEKIKGLKSTNPKAYWDIIKDKKDKKNTPQIPMEMFKKHFEKINKM